MHPRGVPTVVLTAAIATAACAPRIRPTAPAGLTPAQRLDAIDALIRDGCYDCLVDALGRAERLASDRGAESPAPQVVERIRVAAGLLAIRERDLGLVDQHYLEQARTLTPADADSPLLDAIATLPRRSAGRQQAVTDAGLDAMMTARRHFDAWWPQLRAHANDDALAAVGAVSFDCTYGHDRGAGSEPDAAVAAWRDTPLLGFTRATCAGFDLKRLSALLDADPRFEEINYFLGVMATMKGDLEEADRRYLRAYAWRHDWPAAALAIANVAMTAEDFDRAGTFYDATLQLDPANPDAELGRVRAFSFAGKYTDAKAAATRLLSGHWYTGEAYYWRAWNETQLDEDEAAWSDVGTAAKLVINADVPKLTGILAIRRHDLPRARAEFEQAHERNPGDCETLTLLGGTRLELQDWPGAMPPLADAVTCLDHHDDDLRAQIERLRSKPGRERIVARREAEVAADGRLRARSWFNLAVAAYHVGDKVAARGYAERVSTDERFGERARHLLDRLPQ